MTGYHSYGRFSLRLDRTAGAIILKMSHGYDIREDNDLVVSVVDTATEQFSLATSPGAFLVDVFPVLRYMPSWLPGAGFQRKAIEWKRVIDQMADIPHEFVKARMVRFVSLHKSAYMTFRIETP